MAKSLNDLSVGLTEQGLLDGALAAIKEAAEERRRVAAANPAANEADLAMSLSNLLFAWARRAGVTKQSRFVKSPLISKQGSRGDEAAASAKSA